MLAFIPNPAKLGYLETRPDRQFYHGQNADGAAYFWLHHTVACAHLQGEGHLTFTVALPPLIEHGFIT